jgi:pimeloyl-ACP methyl ester carboxylesterase
MSSSKTAISADGTPIAFSAEGNGPPLILVEPAAHFRAFSAFNGLVPLLIDRFTVITYDRRGRGESGDAPDYMPLREVEDLDAIISAIGGPVFAYGYRRRPATHTDETVPVPCKSHHWRSRNCRGLW